MKYTFLFAIASSLALASCAAPGGGGGTAAAETQLGPHSAQKFVMVSRAGGMRGAELAAPTAAAKIALVLTVEQQMVGNQQQITARAGAHANGPNGTLEAVDGLRVHVIQPTEFGTEPRKTGEAKITQSVSSPGGKYRTVVAEASMKGAEWEETKVTLTIPGDQ